MRIKVLSLLATAFLAAALPLYGVTNGQPDGNAHPYVGVMIQPIPSQPGFVTVCSGSALSATKFLTAAHCADPTMPVFVSFKSGPPFGAGSFIPGTFHPDPAWCPGCGPGLQGFDSNDVAVVILSAAANLSGFAALPSPNLADTLEMRTPVDVVGYGTQGFIRGGGPPGQIFLFTRYFAPSLLIQSNNVSSDEFLKLTANPAAGGGICFGDSGGPDLLGGTNIVLGVNSFVTNNNCAGVTYSQRVDLPDILAFINGVK